MEIGVQHDGDEVALPADWEIKSLGDLASFRTGPFGSALHKSDYVTDGIPLVNPMHIVDGSIVPTSDMTVSIKTAYRLSEYALQVGDVIIGRRGEMGRCAVVGNKEAGWLCGTGSLIIRPNDNAAAGFMQRMLASRQVVAAIENASVGSTMVNLNQGILEELEVPTPPLPEQRAIADALSDVDALIERLGALIAKKRAIKTATMQRLLTGKQRLPGFDGEWTTKTLLDLVDQSKSLFDDGDWVESEHITDRGIRLIQTGNIGVGRFIEKDDKKYISDDSFSLLNCKEVKVGDLLICRLAEPAGRACLMPDIGERKMITSVDVTIFRPLPEQADRTYLLNLFSTKSWLDEVELRSGGSTRSRIARGALGKMELTLPPVEEQKAIATILSDMDAEIDALQARREKTQAIKQGMMQELLTGRTRLV